MSASRAWLPALGAILNFRKIRRHAELPARSDQTALAPMYGLRLILNIFAHIAIVVAGASPDWALPAGQIKHEAQSCLTWRFRERGATRCRDDGQVSTPASLHLRVHSGRQGSAPFHSYVMIEWDQLGQIGGPLMETIPPPAGFSCNVPDGGPEAAGGSAPC